MLLNWLFGSKPAAAFRRTVEVFEFRRNIFLSPVVLARRGNKRANPANGKLVSLDDARSDLGKSLSFVLQNSRVDRTFRPRKLCSNLPIEPEIVEKLSFKESGDPFQSLRYCQAVEEENRLVIYPSIKGALHSSLRSFPASLSNAEHCGSALVAAIQECKLDK